MELLDTGRAPAHLTDPDELRAYIRDHKERALVGKVIDEHEAIARFVSDGDYLVYDCNYFQRGPSSLLRELMRQRKRDLWVNGKFTYVALSLLVAAKCVSRVDVGYFGPSRVMDEAARDGEIELYEYSNVELTYRLRAGASGLPFYPVRGFAGTDGFERSAAKLVTDPFTQKPITLLPALNPDVAIIHVHEADQYGNARVYGTGIAHVECALASKKVILSTERVVSEDRIRSNPGLTSIPYYCVDAVVEAPFGAYPGTMSGHYAADGEHIRDLYAGVARGQVAEYLEEWVYGVSSHEETLERLVGAPRLTQLRRAEGEPEGYGTW